MTPAATTAIRGNSARPGQGVRVDQQHRGGEHCGDHRAAQADQDRVEAGHGEAGRRQRQAEAGDAEQAEQQAAAAVGGVRRQDSKWRLRWGGTSRDAT